jgi:hypothetical protein
MRLNIRIDQIVLTGVPAGMVNDLRPLVEQNLALRASRPDAVPPRRPRTLSTSQELADAIADAVWKDAGLSGLTSGDARLGPGSSS